MIEDVVKSILAIPLIFGGRFRAPATSESLAEAEERCGRPLPAELREMLGRFDGMTGPTDVAHGWITLWPSAELASVQEIQGTPGRGDLIAFADHGLSALEYAIEAARPDGRPSLVYMIGFDKPLFDSLGAFLRGMIDDSPLLYGGPTR